MDSRKTDIVIIGGGIIGAAVAHELQSALIAKNQGDRRILLLEKSVSGHGCSYGNAGWLTPCFAMPLPQPGMFWKSVGWLLDPTSPLHIHPSFNPTLARWMFQFLLAMNHRQMRKSIEVLTAISQYSLEAYQELSARMKQLETDIGFEKRGLLMISATKSGLDHAKLEMNLMNDRGISGRFLEKDELMNFEPSIRDVALGGVYFPEEAQIEPYQAVAGLLLEFKSRGGEIAQHTEVYDFEVKKSEFRSRVTKLHTTQGPIEAEHVIMATGAWSKDVARRLGLSLPVLGGKGYSMHIEMHENKPKIPIMIVERKIAITPRATHLFGPSVRVAGTLELVDQDYSISPNRVRSIYEGAKEFLKFDSTSENLAPRDLWRGLRPCTPDGVPVIGPSKRVTNLYYCLGHQLLGLQSAPGSGKLLADLFVGNTPNTDPVPFRADRFE
jgi:D-amino-acid dehydrogenase